MFSRRESGGRAHGVQWRRPYGSRRTTAAPTAEAVAAVAAAAAAAAAAADDPHANCNAIEAEEKNTFGLASNETCQTAFLNIIRPKF